MFKQTIVGTPLNCINRTCKSAFYRESHLGYYPKNEVEVYAIMKCPKCKDTFAIVQSVSIVHEYKEKLPKDPKKVAKRTPISQKEIDVLNNTENFIFQTEKTISVLKPNPICLSDNVQTHPGSGHEVLNWIFCEINLRHQHHRKRTFRKKTKE